MEKWKPTTSFAAIGSVDVAELKGEGLTSRLASKLGICHKLNKEKTGMGKKI